MVDGFDGSPVTASCVLTVDGEMLSSKNCASPIVLRAEVTRFELYSPVGSMDVIAAVAAVAASATAEAASAVVEEADQAPYDVMVTDAGGVGGGICLAALRLRSH